jgi:hypothetical protein
MGPPLSAFSDIDGPKMRIGVATPFLSAGNRFFLLRKVERLDTHCLTAKQMLDVQSKTQ